MQYKLIELRKKRFKLTQQQVAEYLGITVQTYRLKEQGKAEFSQDEMFALSNFFKENMSAIFSPRMHQNGNKNEDKKLV